MSLPLSLDSTRVNTKSPAVKRLLQECKELNEEQSRDFTCEPLEDNIFEWHFALRGPPDTEFQGGIYHGRIVLPPEYPFKPPTFSFLTPNGRFEVNTKICLSISTHHPEHWQPSWSLRTALVALTAFFPTKGDGAIGALAYSADERRALAAASRLAPPASGQSEARQAVATAAHARLLASEGQGPSAFTQDAAIAAAAASITRSAIAAVLAQNECRPQAPSPLRPAPPSPAVAPSPLPAAAPFPLRAAAPDATERRREDDTPLLALAAALSVAILALLVRRLLAWLGGGGVAGLALVAADAGLAAHEAGMLQ